MRRIQTEQIKGNEVLAADVYSDDGVMIISMGTKLKLEYKHKLMELRIHEIFIQDDISKDIDIESFSDEAIGEVCSETLKNTIESFAYTSKSQMKHILDVADGVMKRVCEKKEVLYNVSAVRRKDQKLSDHCLSVAALSILTALHAGISEENTKEMAIGALLHDIGFLKNPLKINEMDVEGLDEETQKKIRLHVVDGYHYVQDKPWLGSISKDIILFHHERLDGSGYPVRLSGDRIKPEVRVVSICDEFDNLIYGTLAKKMKVYEAIEYITGYGNSKFDAELINHFISCVAAYPVGTLVRTNTDETCIVIRQNNQSPTRPVLRQLRIADDGEWETTGVEHDLIKELTIFIIDTVE